MDGKAIHQLVIFILYIRIGARWLGHCVTGTE